MKKLYAYVDETGQETEGSFFLVTTIIVGDERDTLLSDLEEIERQSGKGNQSWHQTRHERRVAYVDRALANTQLDGATFYAVYRDTKAYQDVTRDTIVRALDTREPDRQYRATVIVDGLHRSERRGVAVGLRHAGIPAKKVRGARDQTNALVRLADAMAGFIRDGEEGVADFTERLRQATDLGKVRGLP